MRKWLDVDGGKERPVQQERDVPCVMLSFSLTDLQLRYTMIFFASIPNNCETGAAGEKVASVLG